MTGRRSRTPGRLGTAGALLAASFAGGAASHFMLAGGGTLAGGVRAQGGAGVVTATQVNLVDDGGRLRGVITGGDVRGLASIALYDADGGVRGLLGVEADGTPLLRLHGADGAARLLASVQGDDALVVVGPETAAQGLFGAVQGRPLLTLGDGARGRLQLQLHEQGLPRIALADAAGEEAISLSVGSDDTPQLRLSAAARPRAVLAVAGDATVLNLLDPRRPRLVAGVAENGFPSVTFLDEAGDAFAVVPQ